jgi:hypothetical protein
MTRCLRYLTYTLVSRMVSDCAALEQALTANDTTMIWWFHDRFEAIYVSARTEILSLIPADCVVEPVDAEQQPEQPHPRADDCSKIDNHASLLVPAAVLAMQLCASATWVAFACCRKKERTGHEKAGLLSREAHV